MAFWFITFAPICLTDASLSQITGSWIWTDSFYFIDQSMLSNSSKVITNKNKIQTINWDCYLIYGLFGLWWCNCISTFQLYYCSSYTCGLHTAQRYPIIGLTMSSGPILLLPLAPCLLLSVLEVFWGHFGFKKKKKGCPLPLDLYPYLDDSDWEDIPQKVQQTLTEACVWLRVSITCQNRLYINRGEIGGKGKPICLVSFTSFKCYRNTKMESNNLRCEKYSANFPSPKKNNKTHWFAKEIQIAGSSLCYRNPSGEECQCCNCERSLS